MSSLSTRDLAVIRPLSPRRRYRIVPPTVVETIRTNLRSRTDEALTEQFGISYNTWRKLDAGAAIRESIAERLVTRVLRDFGGGARTNS